MIIFLKSIASKRVIAVNLVLPKIHFLIEQIFRWLVALMWENFKKKIKKLNISSIAGRNNSSNARASFVIVVVENKIL